MKRIFVLMACILTCWRSMGYDKSGMQQQAQPLGFEENKGQITDQYGNTRHDIDYALQVPGLSIYIGKGTIHYQFYKNIENTAVSVPNLKLPKGKELPKSYTTTTQRVDVQLLNADDEIQAVTGQMIGCPVHYYTNSKLKDGATTHTYQQVTYKNILPGIDWVLYVKNGGLKYDFVVHPGASAKNIQLAYAGANELALNAQGALQIGTSYGIITEQAPISYEQDDHKTVASNFRLTNKTLSIETGSCQGTVVIDPGVLWATYYGSGTEFTTPNANPACDQAGAAYITGTTLGIHNIATIGSFQDTLNSGGWNGDCFLVKFDRDGHRMWATYYGDVNYSGSYNNLAPTGISCDKAFHVYLAGYTSETTLATAGSHQDTLNPTPSPYGNLLPTDAFLVQFDSAGLRKWATYYGGAGDDDCYGVTCDADNNAYVYGWTNSADGIATVGAHRTYLGNSPAYDPSNYNFPQSCFLAKFDVSGSLQWGTYYGQGPGCAIFAAACDPNNNIDITGTTQLYDANDEDAFITPGSYMEHTILVSTQAFVAQFNSAGAQQWGTFYHSTDASTTGDFITNSIACADKYVYVTGATQNQSGITTPGAYMETVSPVNSQFFPFLTQFSNDGKKLNWCTYYGQGSGLSVVCDNRKSIFIAGSQTDYTYEDYPYLISTPGSHQDTITGGCFIAQFDSLGRRKWGSFYGVNQSDVMGIASDGGYNIYTGGITYSTSHIATPGSFQPALNTQDSIVGNFPRNAFLVRWVPVDIQLGIVTPHDTTCSGNNPITVTLKNNGYLPTSNITVSAVYVRTNYVTGISTKDSIGATTAQVLNPGGTTTLSLGNINLKYGIDTITFYIHHVTDDSSSANDTVVQSILVNCFPTGVQNVAEAEGIKIYPNPAQEMLNIQLPNDMHANALTIINSIGSEVYKEKIDNISTKSIDISRLVPGYYILHINTANGVYNNSFDVLRK